MFLISLPSLEYVFFYVFLANTTPLFAVVNLTLIDLPGLTKVAVGRLSTCLLRVAYSAFYYFYLGQACYSFQKGSLKVSFKTLRIWCEHMLRR